MKITMLVLLLFLFGACLNEQPLQGQSAKDFNLPIGNKIVSVSNAAIDKNMVDSLHIEYNKFYDEILPDSTKLDIPNDLDLLLKSYYFNQEENNFFNSLHRNNSFCCVKPIIQNNKRVNLYLVKEVPENFEASEGAGYIKKLFLVSFSTLTNKVVDVLNVYNDGVMLYWECVRFFHIDTDLNIYLKDYSINEDEYKCINYQVFNFTSEGYFKRNDTLSKNDIIVTDSISNFEWNGTYDFNQTFLRYMDEFKLKYSIKIINEQSAHLLSKVNDRIKEYTATVTSFNNDGLVLNYMDNNDNSEELILYKTKEGYAIGGQSIYLLNPPNDRYSIKKSNKK